MRRSAMLGEAGYARRPLDDYPTPEWVTEALLRHVPLRRNLWEPAAGRGNMARVLARHAAVTATDLHDYPDRDHNVTPGVDFLACTVLPAGVEGIVTNPPFGGRAEAFVLHALKLTQPVGGQVCMLLNRLYDTAKSRRDLWRHPFEGQLVLTQRIYWVTERRAAPRQNHAWFIWDWAQTNYPLTRPQLRYASL